MSEGVNDSARLQVLLALQRAHVRAQEINAFLRSEGTDLPMDLLGDNMQADTNSPTSSASVAYIKDSSRSLRQRQDLKPSEIAKSSPGDTVTEEAYTIKPLNALDASAKYLSPKQEDTLHSISQNFPDLNSPLSDKSKHHAQNVEPKESRISIEDLKSEDLAPRRLDPMTPSKSSTKIQPKVKNTTPDAKLEKSSKKGISRRKQFVKDRHLPAGANSSMWTEMVCAATTSNQDLCLPTEVYQLNSPPTTLKKQLPPRLALLSSSSSVVSSSMPPLRPSSSIAASLWGDLMRVSIQSPPESLVNYRPSSTMTSALPAVQKFHERERDYDEGDDVFLKGDNRLLSSKHPTSFLNFNFKSVENNGIRIQKQRCKMRKQKLQCKQERKVRNLLAKRGIIKPKLSPQARNAKQTEDMERKMRFLKRKFRIQKNNQGSRFSQYRDQYEKVSWPIITQFAKGSNDDVLQQCKQMNIQDSPGLQCHNSCQIGTSFPLMSKVVVEHGMGTPGASTSSTKSSTGSMDINMKINMHSNCADSADGAVG